MRLFEMRARDVRTVHMFRFLLLLSIISSAFPCQYLCSFIERILENVCMIGLAGCSTLLWKNKTKTSSANADNMAQKSFH
jgi:hypothetical protein